MSAEALLENEYKRLEAEYARRQVTPPRNPWFSDDEDVVEQASASAPRDDDE